MNIGTEYSISYDYDAYGRLSGLTNGADVFTYSYLANSNLQSGLTMPNGITINNSYEANRNLLSSVENKFGTTTVSRYDYVNNAIANRTSMAKSGTAFPQADTITYGYNGRSEVTSATAQNDTNYVYSYQFDNIGNRLTATESGTAKTYTSNALNQYTAITNPAKNPTYDDDGNMLNDGTWSLTWDAENRLVKAEKGTDKLEFMYDYQSRRIDKKVYDGTTLNSHKRFVYDGYLQIEELDGLNNNDVTKKRIWNGDKLISEIRGTTTYYAVGDANKNITEYLDASGNIKAHYEYSPFGKITAKTGDMQDSFDYRFSSEYFDIETGFVYYNFRYYSPDLGRWLSRDPIEEEGGINLYGFNWNDGINLIDFFGLMSCDDCKKLKKKMKNILNTLKDSIKDTSDIADTIKDLATDRFAIGVVGALVSGGQALKALGKAGFAASKLMKSNTKREILKQTAELKNQPKIANKIQKQINKSVQQYNKAVLKESPDIAIAEMRDNYINDKAKEYAEQAQDKNSDSLGNRYLDALNDGEDTFKKLEDTANSLDDSYNKNAKQLKKLGDAYRENCK